MSNKTVDIYTDNDAEMLCIKIDGEVYFEGNFWDFNTPDDIVYLVQKLGHETTEIMYEYDN